MEFVSGELFFRGVIRQPEGSGEKVVVAKALRALAERIATREADKCGWDWFVEHCEVLSVDASGHQFRVLEQWSSLAGYECFVFDSPLLEGVS